MNNFKVVACDTDSIFFKKEDEAPFSEEEITKLNDQLNSLYPDLIRWELNGLFKTKVTLKAKNYVLWDGKTLKIKGSALRGSTREPALQALIKEMVDAMVYGTENYQEIYVKYILEALNVKDIKRWAFRKTISDAVLNSERMNEEKVRLALDGADWQPGDRRYFFYRSDNSMCLVENFVGEYDKIKLVRRVYDTIKIFGTVVDINLFTKYHLKGKRKELDELVKAVV
jgi:DNA polymerase elongation subunit (family B)